MRNSSLRLRWWIAAGLLCVLAAAGVGTVSVLNTYDDIDVDVDARGAELLPNAAMIQRGDYLARAGNCQSCHTQAGGALFAGGKGISTPFGVIYAGNLTPDKKTGLGTWNASHFWRAMHHGRSKDGRRLYPAFPYQQYSLITRNDSDALFMYLRSLPAVEQRNQDHALGFPFNTQAALAVWQAMYFTPLKQETVPGQSPEWQRGRYLVEGLGHCAACHSPRNALGAMVAGRQFSGGQMLSEKWVAPSLLAMDEAGVMDWPTADVVQLLQAGHVKSAQVNGPMAAVVFGSTQYLSETDLSAMAVYLKALPASSKATATFKAASNEVLQRGGRLYEKHCAECHGDQGEGKEAVYPALRGNRAVTMVPTDNLVNVIRQGGFGPVTAKNPRPYGMPPFSHVLSPRELADVTTFIRQSWGNRALAVDELEVLRVQ